MNNYPKHVGDYIKDTVGLSMLEDGAYNRMMDQYYSTERPLPLDRKACYRLARCTTGHERKAVDYILDVYFVQTAAGYRQKRIDEELEAYGERVKIARENGKRGGRPGNDPGPKNSPNGHKPATEEQTKLDTKSVPILDTGQITEVDTKRDTKSVTDPDTKSGTQTKASHKPLAIDLKKEKALDAPLGVINGGRPGQSASGPGHPPDDGDSEKRRNPGAAIQSAVAAMTGSGKP